MVHLGLDDENVISSEKMSYHTSMILLSKAVQSVLGFILFTFEKGRVGAV